jgi:hypothetical protein
VLAGRDRLSRLGDPRGQVGVERPELAVRRSPRPPSAGPASGRRAPAPARPRPGSFDGFGGLAAPELLVRCWPPSKSCHRGPAYWRLWPAGDLQRLRRRPRQGRRGEGVARRPRLYTAAAASRRTSSEWIPCVPSSRARPRPTRKPSWTVAAPPGLRALRSRAGSSTVSIVPPTVADRLRLVLGQAVGDRDLAASAAPRRGGGERSEVGAGAVEAGGPGSRSSGYRGREQQAAAKAGCEGEESGRAGAAAIATPAQYANCINSLLAGGAVDACR